MWSNWCLDPAGCIQVHCWPRGWGNLCWASRRLYSWHKFRRRSPWFHDGIQRQRPEETEFSRLDSILEIRAAMEKPLHTYLHQLVKLFNTTCITVLLHGCESWVISKYMEKKINYFGTSCYRIMLNIKRIDRVLNATIYSLIETAPLIALAIVVPWSCAPLAWKRACQRICNVCSYSWEEETRKTANLLHQLYSLSSGGCW